MALACKEKQSTKTAELKIGAYVRGDGAAGNRGHGARLGHGGSGGSDDSGGGGGDVGPEARPRVGPRGAARVVIHEVGAASPGVHLLLEARWQRAGVVPDRSTRVVVDKIPFSRVVQPTLPSCKEWCDGDGDGDGGD